MASLPLRAAFASAALGLGMGLKRLFRKKPKMTMQRQRIYEAVLTSLKPPDKLREMAVAFRAEGLTEQADLIEKRAILKELPDSVRAKRRLILKEALTWTDVVKIRGLAAVYDSVGSTGAAALLRRYAAGLPKPVVERPVVRRRRINQSVQSEFNAAEFNSSEFNAVDSDTDDDSVEKLAAESLKAFDNEINHTEIKPEEIETVRTELEIEPAESDPTTPESLTPVSVKIRDVPAISSEPNSGIRSSKEEMLEPV